ncbi:MAG: FeoB small GTPase domain-containing protein, partial [Opitutales bacterium]
MSEDPTDIPGPVSELNIAIAGNPNTGKSSLFNRLTGLRQRVGNYPGVTVEKKTGLLRLGGLDMNLVDLPGTYSLSAASPDEAVVIEYLLGSLK